MSDVLSTRSRVWLSATHLSRCLAVLLAVTLFSVIALPAHAATVSNGVLFTRGAFYNYAPSVIQTGTTRQYWWCGQGTNPLTGVMTDTIFYRSYNTSTGVYAPITMVLYPSAGPNMWDEAYTCDPSVIKGAFVDPDNATTYSYAMYYTATDRGPHGIDAGTSLDGTNNRVGIAYSNDGVHWVKYSANPIIYPQVYPTNAYGAGQAATYNGDGVAGVYLFATDTSTSRGVRMWVRHTTDGIHFGSPTLISNAGLVSGSAPAMANSDYAYDYKSNQFYAAIELPARNTGDRETYRLGLYIMSASNLLGGTGTWTPKGYIDSNLTGSYLNHSPGLVRDNFGNVTPFLPTVEVIFAEGTNDPSTWNLAEATWSQGTGTTAFKRYYNSSVGSHWVTSGFVASGYTLESTLGYLYTTSQSGTVPLYGCVSTSFTGNDHFVSPSSTCEGQVVLGVNGWIYSSPPTGISTVALYRCFTGTNHFVSTSASCEGTTTESLLGYAKTSA